MFTALIASLLGSMTLAAIVQPIVDGAEDEEDTFEPLTAPEELGDAAQVGDAGGDLLEAAAGRDWLAGGRGGDTLDGGAGNDTLFGEPGRDLLLGGEGDDLLDGGAWHDALDGGAGDDMLLGQNGMDTLFGGEGDDILNGGAWDDLLVGGAGADVLSGESGDDLLFGYVPDDEGLSPVSAEAFHEALEATYDNAEDFAALDADAQQAAAEAALDHMRDLHPGALAGDDGGDTLSGGDGNDTLYGNDGDLLSGDGGDDDFVITELQPTGGGIVIEDFGTGQDDLVVEYDASAGGLEPLIEVITDVDGNQQVTADGNVVATLTQPLTPITVEDVLVVGLMEVTL
ncbi:calcium-binding protein [Sagittula sp. SSi028]|uniref:calcium-binding protein n=1 Tax=Sagittula sp. SSi028 TaxID=3400636 RepID=UPI003AF97A55